MINIIFRQKHFRFWAICFIDPSRGFASRLQWGLPTPRPPNSPGAALLKITYLQLILTSISVVEMKRFMGFSNLLYRIDWKCVPMKIPFLQELFNLFGKLCISCLSLLAIMQMVFSFDSERHCLYNDFLLSSRCCFIMPKYTMSLRPSFRNKKLSYRRNSTGRRLLCRSRSFEVADFDGRRKHVCHLLFLSS